jgi:nucleotide-binding universal stress UspA family protein
MYRKVIVGYDGSESADDALALGKLIAEHSGAQLVVAGVFPLDPLWGGSDSAFQEAEAEYAREIERAAESVGGEAEAIPSSSAARGLRALAEETEADLIVVGSAHHGRAGQIFAGSVGMSLLHGSPCSVAIAPRSYSDDAERRLAEIAVGFDGSQEAGMALVDAIELARDSRALLKIVAVAEPPAISYGKGGGAQGWQELTEAIKEMMRERLTDAVESVPDDVRVEAVLVRGEPATALAEIVTADEGLLMIGSRAYGPLRRVLLGSVATALVRWAPCPVIVHPRPTKAAAREAEAISAGNAG